MNFYHILDTIVSTQAQIPIKKISEEKIAKNTFNTWQPGRDITEITLDTTQGKKAENVIQHFFSVYTQFTYLSYDDIRIDKFEKHAPFDGLIFNSNNVKGHEIKALVDVINTEIMSSIDGQISSGVRKKITLGGVYTVEIKSTKVNKNKIETAKTYQKQNQTDKYTSIISAIREDDYLAYPFWTRVGDMNFDQYILFAGERLSLDTSLGKTFTVNKIIEHEVENLSDVHIRVYLDDDKDLFYIMGYVIKKAFFENPIIKKMIKKGKSEQALYFSVSLKLGHSLLTIDKDPFFYKSHE